jgi:hypothetical protein
MILRRLSAIRSLAAYDLKDRTKTRELLPETKQSDLINLTEDGSFLTYAEDITKKDELRCELAAPKTKSTTHDCCGRG